MPVNQTILKTERETFNCIDDPVFIHDKDYRLVLVNDAYCRAAGTTEEAALGKCYWEVFPPGQGPLPECERVARENNQKPARDEVAVGDRRYISNSYPFRHSGTASPWYLHILAEITGSTMVDEKVNASNRLLQTIINNVPVRVFWKDRNLRYLGANALFARDAGYTDGEELVGKSDLDMVWGEQAEDYRSDDKQVMDSGMPKLDYDEPQTTPTGDKIWLRTSKVPLRDQDDNVMGMLGIYYDITDRKKAEDKMQRLATTDPLTGLTNHRQFDLLAVQYLKLAKREGKVLALMMLDLDKFKPVNDQYGHPVGDALLIEISKHLKDICRDTDVVARLGGDEFAVILTNLENPDGAHGPAQKIIEALSTPMEIMGHTVQIGTSIGIALYPDHSEDMDSLITKADDALYEAKNAGRNTFRLSGTAEKKSA